MKQVGSFRTIAHQRWYFKGCDTCGGACCNGAKGFTAAPLILEDFEAVYQHFPIVFSVKENALVAYVLLNDGKGYCPYFEHNRCSIYDQRPPACKLYPISPYFEHILVDTSCPSVNAFSGTLVCQNGVLESAFYTQRLENFVAKKEATERFFARLYRPEDFAYLGDVSGLPLYQYIKPHASTYVQMHKASLKHFWNYFGVDALRLKEAVS